MNRVTNKLKKNFVGFLFGLVFFSTGLFAAYASFGKMAFGYHNSSDWVQVPVVIKSLKLDAKRGDSTTYKVTSRYSYKFNNKKYNNTRVSLSSGSDNIDDYWQSLYNDLNKKRQNNTAVVWVNPNDPDQALLDRTFRWGTLAFGMLFLIGFGGVGLAIMIWSLIAKSNQQILESANNGINSNEKHGHWVMIGLGVLFASFGLFPLIVIIPEVIDKQKYESLLVLLFAAAGIWMFIFGLRQRSAYKLIGPSPLFLDPLPGSIGGQVGGYFDINASVVDQLEITLSCIKRTKSGKNTTSTTIWQTNAYAYSQLNSNGTRNTFIFDCPDNLPATTEWENRSSIHWEIATEGNLTLKQSAKKISRHWEIPVEDNTSATMSNLSIPASHFQKTTELRAQQAAKEAEQQLIFNQQGPTIEFIRTNEIGKRFHTLITGLIFGISFGGPGIFIVISEKWWPGYIFIVIGFLILTFSIFSIGKRIDLRVNTQSRILNMRRRWFMFPLYKREVALFEPSQLSTKKTHSVTYGKKLTKYYSILINNDGKKVTIAEDIKGKNVADLLLERITKQVFPNRLQ